MSSLRGWAVDSVHRRFVLTAAQLVAIAWFSPGAGLPLDDAWIHQVVARTFAETGTLGFAPGQHGAAATSYLWAALLAVNFKVAHVEPSRWALGLNVVAALAAGQLLFTLALRARPRRVAAWPWVSFVATVFACVSPNVLWFVTSGMEAMPFLALSLATIVLARSRWAGLAAGFLALLRPEAAPLGAIVALVYLWNTRSLGRTFVLALPWLAAIALYVGTNLAFTGHALPPTLAGRRWLWFQPDAGESRPDFVLDFLGLWAFRLSTYTLDASRPVLYALLAVATFGAVRVRARLLVTWALFHTLLYAVMLPTTGHGGRYQPFVPLLFAFFLPLGTMLLVGHFIRLGWLVVPGVVPWIILAAPAAKDLRRANGLAVAHIARTELAAGIAAKDLPGDVASFDIGGIGWNARRTIHDAGGLSDPNAAKLLETGRIWTWLEAHDVRWLILPAGYERTLPDTLDFRSRLGLRDNPAIELEPTATWETAPLDWQPAVTATWNAAPRQILYRVTYTHRPGPRLVEPVTTTREVDADLPRKDRAIAGRMLATLDAWGARLDLTLTRELGFGVAKEPPLGRGCTVQFGEWGFGTSGCPAALEPMLYRSLGRYLDVGDLAGALRVIPHLFAAARRQDDPTFLPLLAPVELPVPRHPPRRRR